ncbi:hypothetical protein [Kitasatospora sp. NPDC004289]
MRAPHRQSATPAALLGAVALALVGLVTVVPAAAEPPRQQVVRNGDFAEPLSSGWSCTGDVTLTDRIVEGRPGPHEQAGCTQAVRVVPGSTYELTAEVSGSYAFVTVEGVPKVPDGKVTRWADGPGWTTLTATVSVVAVNQVILSFHGWYGQGPFRIGRIAMTDVTAPGACVLTTPAWPPSPTVSSPRPTISPSPSPSPSPTWTADPSPSTEPRPYWTWTCTPSLAAG